MKTAAALKVLALAVLWFAHPVVTTQAMIEVASDSIHDAAHKREAVSPSREQEN